MNSMKRRNEENNDPHDSRVIPMIPIDPRPQHVGQGTHFRKVWQKLMADHSEPTR